MAIVIGPRSKKPKPNLTSSEPHAGDADHSTENPERKTNDGKNNNTQAIASPIANPGARFSLNPNGDNTDSTNIDADDGVERPTSQTAPSSMTSLESIEKEINLKDKGQAKGKGGGGSRKAANAALREAIAANRGQVSASLINVGELIVQHLPTWTGWRRWRQRVQHSFLMEPTLIDSLLFFQFLKYRFRAPKSTEKAKDHADSVLVADWESELTRNNHPLKASGYHELGTC